MSDIKFRTKNVGHKISDKNVGQNFRRTIYKKKVYSIFLGATCSKSVTITLNDTTIYLSRGSQMKVTPAARAGAVMKRNFQVVKSTFFDTIYAEGITIMWDRGTRVLVSLDPKYRGMYVPR